MAQGFPHRPEDLCELQHPGEKLGTVANACPVRNESRGGKVPGACWPASPGQWLSPGPKERPCEKK